MSCANVWFESYYILRFEMIWWSCLIWEKVVPPQMKWKWWSMCTLWMMEFVPYYLKCLMIWSWCSLWVWFIVYECYDLDDMCDILLVYHRSPWKWLLSFEGECCFMWGHCYDPKNEVGQNRSSHVFHKLIMI